MAFVAYPDIFISGLQNSLFFYDSDGTNTLDGYKSATIAYTPEGGTQVSWNSTSLIPVFYVGDDGHRHVRAVVIQFIPVLLPSTFLRKLAAIFKALKKLQAGSGTGTLTGTLNTDDARPTGTTPPSVTMNVTFFDPA